nr:hypothetical protein [uncultured Draconibacterium sp.]
MIGAFVRRSIYWTSDFLKGSPIRSQYDDIRRIMENPPKGEILRKLHLRNILKHATTYSPFYNKQANKPLSEFPVMNKSLLLEKFEDIKIPHRHIPNQKGELYIQRTSGSTGTPFAIPQDTRKRNRRLADLKYFGKIVGFKSHNSLVHMRAWNNWQNKSKLQTLKENIIAFNISNINNERLNNLCEIINKKKISALRGYASSIDLFIQYAVEKNIKLPSLKIMIAGSEALLDSTRTMVKKHIGCEIISQYANEENGILAQERIPSREKNHFYLNHASYFFELLKLDSDEPAQYGELGRIVVTDIFNYAFPMIRYDTGDTGILIEKDQYSNGYPVLSNLYGRRFDLIYDTKNNPIHPMAIGRILKNSPQINQWQFIQKSRKEYLLKIASQSEVAEINPIVELLGPGAKVSIEKVNNIPILASGKRKPVVNEWKQ